MNVEELFEKLEVAIVYEPVYSYDIKIANQIIREYFENKISLKQVPCLEHDFSIVFGNFRKCSKCGFVKSV